MALGIASALRCDATPNPLPIEPLGYVPEDPAQLLKYIVDIGADSVM